MVFGPPVGSKYTWTHTPFRIIRSDGLSYQAYPFDSPWFLVARSLVSHPPYMVNSFPPISIPEIWPYRDQLISVSLVNGRDGNSMGVSTTNPNVRYASRPPNVL